MQDLAHRPITFAFNGGPGSSSIWLHMGILGPRRVVVNDAGYAPPPPSQRVDNEFSVLDVTDLVMIDPVGTGFSKPLGEAKGADFWGVDQDIKSVGAFIKRWVTENGRWASPKYVLGESYGGMRSAGLAHHLQSVHGMNLNGVVLVVGVLVLMAPLPLVPFVNTLPGIAIILLCLGLAERDGVMIVAGYVTTLVSTADVAVILWFAYKTGTNIDEAWQMVQGLLDRAFGN